MSKLKKRQSTRSSSSGSQEDVLDEVAPTTTLLPPTAVALLWAGYMEDSGIDTAWTHFSKGARFSTVKNLALLLSVAFALFLRWTTGLSSYSGHGTPPLFGDYEAQRHWMEITLHLPISQWYHYDLSYWGLDYPPLTAYVSWVCGYIGAALNPEWFALEASRGHEDAGSKAYLRLTVLVSDLLIYLPSLIGFTRRYWSALPQGVPHYRITTAATLLLLTQPALTIIDHGHFQYNGIMLGLVLHAYNAMWDGQYLWGAVCFTLALSFKQMALYFALPVFAFLLGQCFLRGKGGGITLFLRLGLTVGVTLALVFAPFLHSGKALGQIFTRVFPLQRGLYAEKVEKVWCALGPVLKLRERFTQDQLLRFSALSTLLACLPSVLSLLCRPDRRRFIYALASSSLAFFLFSYQVHEKSILLPLLPVSMLLLDEPTLVPWFVNAATFSMYPLLKRDGVLIPLFAGWALWNWLGGFLPGSVRGSPFLQIVIWLSYIGMAIVMGLDLLVSPPAHLPDLWTMGNVAISAAVFILSWVWITGRSLGWIPSSIPTPPSLRKSQ